MELNNLLQKILSLGRIEKEGFSLIITLHTEKINTQTIELLHKLLNLYSDYSFIILKNIPYCLMPNACNNLLYEENLIGKCMHDKICQQCFYKTTCPGWPRNINISRENTYPIKSYPKEVVLEITSNCNLNCKICTMSKTPNDVNLTTIKNIITQAKKLSIPAIRFTGGEPLLHKDITDMLKYAKEKNFYTLLNTNATTLDNDTLNMLSNYLDNILISLQGFDQKSNSFLTNSPLDFKNKITNMLRLKNRIPITRVGTIISPILINNFKKYYLLLKRLSINNWELYRPMVGSINQEYIISKKEILYLIKQIFSLKNKGIKIKIANPIPFCISKNINLSLATLLGAIADDGHSRIVWDSKGYFKPSYFIDKNLGNTISKAWHNPFIKKIRSLSFLPSKCKSCKYLKWCKGGSRVWAHKINNNYYSLDPLI